MRPREGIVVEIILRGCSVLWEPMIHFKKHQTQAAWNEEGQDFSVKQLALPSILMVYESPRAFSRCAYNPFRKLIR